MKEDLDINHFIELLIESKNIVLSIIASAIVFSIIYSLSATNYYKAYAYILPPQTKYVQPLNIVDSDGDLLSQETPIKPDDIYNSFIRNVQSRKFQREYFFDNAVKLFDELDKDLSFENNFHKNLSFELSSKTTSRDIRSQSFLTLTFIDTDPQRAASILNEYIDMVNQKTAEDFTEGVNQLIRTTRNSLIAEIDGKRLLAKRITQDRIKRLEEAFSIAKKLNIVDRVTDSTNSQNVVLSGDKNISSDTPLYLYGTKSLRAEIDVLTNRESFEAFIPGLRALEQKAEGLKNIVVNSFDVKSAQIDQPANPPTMRFTPKRKIIVLMGGIIGVFISFLYLLYLMIVRREQNK
jgi:chain length determinant protein (polysaccharide antigen chain regulator)